MVLQIQEVDHLLDLLARGDLGGPGATGEEDFAPQTGLAVCVAADQQVLQHGGVLEQLDVLEGAGNAQAGHAVRRLGGQLQQAVGAGVVDLARGGRVDAADEVEHRGLAGAVGADQGEHLAPAHVEADVVHGQHAAEADAEVAGGKQHFLGHFRAFSLSPLGRGLG